MKQFNAFTFIVVFSLSVERVLCLGSQKDSSNVGPEKRDAFSKQGHFIDNVGNESAKHLRFDGTELERNGKSKEDRNDSPITKKGRTYLPLDVNRRNHDNYTFGYIVRKSKMASVQDKNKKSRTMHEGRGMRNRETFTLGRSKRSTVNNTVHYEKENGSSFEHGIDDGRERDISSKNSTDETNATTNINDNGRKRRSSPPYGTVYKNATAFIKHDRRRKGSSSEERNFTAPIKLNGRERGNSHRADDRNITTYIKHGRKEIGPSSLTHYTDKESATKHVRNDSRKSAYSPTYVSAESNFSENRNNNVYDSKIRDDNNSSTYQRHNLVLKVKKGTKIVKPPPEKRKMICCVNKVYETVPAVNLTLPSGRFSWVSRKAPIEIKTPRPILLIQKVLLQNFTATIYKRVTSISLDKVFIPWNEVRRVPVKCPKSKPFFDAKTKTCKQITVPSLKVRIHMSLGGKNETMDNNSNVSFEATISNTRKITKECTVLQKFEKDEYTVLDNNGSTVYVKNTGEVLQSQDFFRNASLTNDSQAIFVCRQHQISNCSGVYILINEGEFRVLMNKSIFVNASKRTYNWSEYTWINKSVLVCENLSTTYYKSKLVSNDDPVLTTLTIVCMSLSIIGLVFVLVTYSLFSELRTPPGINLMNLSVSILLAQLLWLLGSGQTDTPMACTVIAVILHYLFLVSFMWTSIIAFDTWRAFSAKGRRPLAGSGPQQMKHCLRHMAVGWLPVILYVGLCVTLDELNIVAIGYGTAYGCWIAHYHAKLYFFGIPVLAIILFNFTQYSMTVKAIRQTRSQTRVIDKEQFEKKKDFCVYVRVGALMGFTWIFGFAAPFGLQFLWYPFVILNSLQGLYIALAFGGTMRTRKLYIDWVRGKQQAKEKCASNSEKSTKQSAVVLDLQGLTPTPV